jgi:adenine-specific DNA-methyltransferase
MPKNDYSSWSKEDLIKKINALEKRKKYGLVWDSAREPEKVVLDCQKELPVLKEDKAKEIITDSNQPTHILIEGDNYHALSVLNYTHEKTIDVIYIDPPYNTGARDWKYNNDYVDINDMWRHSKWISIMEKRLKLARHLLKESGVLLVAIDDHEIHNLRHILNDIMGEKNYIATICIEVNPAGQNLQPNTPAVSHDYCLIYAKTINKTKLILRKLSDEELKLFKEEDENGKFLWDNLRRRGGNSTPKDRPGQWFPLYVDLVTNDVSLSKSKNSIEVWPIDPKGIKRIWRVNPEGFEREYEAGNISVINKAGRAEIVMKSYAPMGRKPKTVWTGGRYSATTYGTKLLIDILGKNVFNYPKSLYLIEDLLRYYANPSSIVLDFMAGSGTTGHAVLSLNKEDGGSRQFILCTDNENNICTDVCYPRIQKVIDGYKNSRGGNITGLGGNLKYYTTAFVPAAPTDKNKELLTKQSIEMLTLKEGTFEKVTGNPSYVIYRNSVKYTGIIFDQLSFGQFKKAIATVSKPISLYIFSLADDDFSDDFADMKGLIKICAIPESILRVYRRIFR